MLTRSGLDVVVGRALGTVVMTVRGPLSPDSARDLVLTVEEAVDGQHPQRVVLDLTGVTDLKDEGVEVLQEAKAAAEARQVQFQVTARSQEVLSRLSDDGRFTVV